MQYSTLQQLKKRVTKATRLKFLNPICKIIQVQNNIKWGIRPFH